jgi:hypothetical protein
MEALTAALQWCVARCERPVDIYSDCVTNFVGADRELRNFMKIIKADTTQEAGQRYLCD